jgi:hypothetical protein
MPTTATFSFRFLSRVKHSISASTSSCTDNMRAEVTPQRENSGPHLLINALRSAVGPCGSSLSSLSFSFFSSSLMIVLVYSSVL